jgi:hypothetical protein
MESRAEESPAMTARKKTRRKKRLESGAGPPAARIPLPKKGEKKHRDRTHYDRREEKRRLREETANLPR